MSCVYVFVNVSVKYHVMCLCLFRVIYLCRCRVNVTDLNDTFENVFANLINSSTIMTKFDTYKKKKITKE